MKYISSEQPAISGLDFQQNWPSQIFFPKEIPSAMGEGHEHFLELDIIAKRTQMI